MLEREMIDKIKSGDISLFGKLTKEYQNLVFRIAMGYTHNKSDAEDLTQDIFIKVYQSIHQFNHQSEFTTWLYRIAVNMSINYINRNRKFQLWDSLEHIFNISHCDKPPIEDLEISERDEKIKVAIDSLQHSQKTAFILSYYEELSQKQISEVMNKSEGAVEQLLQCAKKNLQKKLSHP